MVTDHFATSLSVKDLEIVAAVPPGGNWRHIPASVESRRLDQIRVTAAQGLGSRSTYYGRLQWHKPAYTINTYIGRPGNGCFIHPAADRLLTIREAARIQSFPDLYAFSGTARQRQTQVGNAVPPILAYQLGKTFSAGRYVDVFSGAGGLSLGLEWAGFECIAAVDSDAAAAKTFEANRTKGTALVADLSDPVAYAGTISTIRQRLGRATLDLLAGGPPCQGFSTAGKNLREDPRNNLVWVFVRLVEDLSPRIVLMENVPALAWKRGLSTLTEIRKRFESLDYYTSMIIAHAEGYGVPQMRRRLFLLAVKDIRIARWPLPTFGILEPSYRQHQPFAGQSSDRPPFTVRDAIGDLSVSSTGALEDTAPYGEDASSPYQLWARGQRPLVDIIPESLFTAGLFQQSLL